MALVSHATIKHQKNKEKLNILDSKINMLLDAKTKTSSITKIPPQQFIFLHFQSTLQKLHGLLPSNSHIASNLLITSNPKGSNSVSCCWELKQSNGSINSVSYYNYKIKLKKLPFENTGVCPLNCSKTYK